MVCIVIMSPSSSSSLPPHRAHELSVLLCSLLQEEKKHTQKWLRAEMDRLVDPLVDSVFNRLTNKLANADLNQKNRKEPEIKEEFDDEQTTNHELQNQKHNPDILSVLSNHNLTDWQVEHQEKFYNQQQQMVNPSDHVNSSNLQSSNFNPDFLQPHSSGDEDEYDPEILAQVKREIKEEQNEMELKNVMDNATQNQQIEQIEDYGGEDMIYQVGHIVQHVQFDQVVTQETKEELNDEDQLNHNNHRFHVNYQVSATTPNHSPELNATTHEGSNVKEEFDDKETTNQLELIPISNQTQNRYTSLTLSNEQSNHNLTNSEDEEEDEVNLNTQQLGDESSDDTYKGEMMENGDGEESRFVGKAIIDTTRLHSTGQSQAFFIESVKRKQPHEECSQVSNEADIRDHVEDIEQEDTEDITSRSVKRPRTYRPTTSNDTQVVINPNHQVQIITVTLRCDQVNCEKMIDKDQFNWHMLKEHSIRPFRCPVKDCKQSFDHSTALRHHRAQSHQSTSQWHCDKCPKNFGTYHTLSQHNIKYHQFGHFQCSFSACTFTGEYKMKVYNHYTQQHKPPFNCDQAGCSYVAPNVPNLKQHLQAHLEPYLCKWPQCHFASATQATTLAHIRLVHLKKCAKTYSKVSTQSPQIDPNDYLELIRFK